MNSLPRAWVGADPTITILHSADLDERTGEDILIHKAYLLKPGAISAAALTDVITAACSGEDAVSASCFPLAFLDAGMREYDLSNPEEVGDLLQDRPFHVGCSEKTKFTPSGDAIGGVMGGQIETLEAFVQHRILAMKKRPSGAVLSLLSGGHSGQDYVSFRDMGKVARFGMNAAQIDAVSLSADRDLSWAPFCLKDSDDG